ncbi:ABC transporter permease [Natronosporangium hydrolyticum]|uniref:ABC transporter permease n=1 Tax=Natronosporangium hydrolyticum TaxID=2811111 RepID=A0A895YJB0_9ACTN|nr:ABC transporter permease [Natronosporangium hydrolyticum]QSB14686.1 ABC transporter permease [Natronosporangium hydrolyticum]
MTTPRRNRSALALVGQRLLALPIILLAVAAFTFALAQLSPRDPVQSYATVQSPLSDQTAAEIEAAWGLDQPVHLQFWHWLSNLARGDFGNSRLLAGQPVLSEIGARLLPSAILIGVALLLVLIGGLVLGVTAAAFRDRWPDRIVRTLCYVNLAAPSFWLGLLGIWLFSVTLGWLPPGGMTDPRALDPPLVDLRHLVLPALTLAAAQHAWFTLYVRNTLLEVRRADYVQFAEASGVRRTVVLFRHALPNALLPFLTLTGAHLAELIGGAVLAETIFGWPGVGQLTVQAALAVDLPLLLAITLFGTVLVVLGNLTADLLYRVADPRVREPAP